VWPAKRVKLSTVGKTAIRAAAARSCFRIFASLITYVGLAPLGPVENLFQLQNEAHLDYMLENSAMFYFKMNSFMKQ
jgi:hypothetical protein